MQNFSKIIISGIMLNSVAMPEETTSFFMNDEDSIKVEITENQYSVPGY